MGLDGITVLVTRAASQSRQLRRMLEDLGAEVRSIPTITIGPPETWDLADRAIRRLNDFDWVIFASTNAVDAFLDRAGTSPRAKIAAVGTETGRRLQERGVEVDLVPEDFRAEGLIKSFSSNLTGLRILLPSAQIGTDSLPNALRQRGAHVDIVPVYQNEMPSSGGGELVTLLKAGIIDCITLTSGSTARNLIRMVDVPDPLRMLESSAVAVIGPVTRKTAIALGLHVDIEPAVATIPALVDAIHQYFETS